MCDGQSIEVSVEVLVESTLSSLRQNCEAIGNRSTSSKVVELFEPTNCHEYFLMWCSCVVVTSEEFGFIWADEGRVATFSSDLRMKVVFLFLHEATT
jgi:hypothetical protein